MNTSHLPFVAALAAPSPDWLQAYSGVELVYLAAAVLGGFVMLIQVVLSLFGADHGMEHDIGHDVGHDGGDGHDPGIASWLSFRAIVAFLTFFGLGGLIASARGMGGLSTLGIAFGAGLTALFLTRLILMQFDKLRSSGTVDVRNAVGTEARVYLTIPAAKSGQGAVTVGIQGRTMQYRAITPGPELKTGALCKVSAVHASDTLVVDAL